MVAPPTTAFEGPGRKIDADSGGRPPATPFEGSGRKIDADSGGRPPATPFEGPGRKIDADSGGRPPANPFEGPGRKIDADSGGRPPATSSAASSDHPLNYYDDILGFSPTMKKVADIHLGRIDDALRQLALNELAAVVEERRHTGKSDRQRNRLFVLDVQ